jgi:hypothetical protein
VTLSWTKPAHGGAAITSYRIYRGTTTASQSLLATIGTGTSFADTSASNGTTYYYRVAAVNSAGEGSRSDVVSAAPSATPLPPPPPADPATGTGSGTSSTTPPSGNAKAPTELSVLRATIVPGQRLFKLVARVAGAAGGDADISLAAAGRTTRFSKAIVDHGIRVSRRISRAQAAAGTALVTIDYPGDSQTRPLRVRLRAASRRARLTLERPRIANGRLKAAGTITARAAGVVRIRLEFVVDGLARTLHFSAAISSGRWKLDRELSPSQLAQINRRSGTVHSYTLYAGSRSQRISGELRSFKILG